MNRLSTRIAVVASLLLLALAVHSGDAAAQSVKSVAGTYTIVSTEAFGKDARGTLMLGADGRYSTVLARATLPKFAAGSRVKGTADEMKAVIDGSLAHVGRYTIDDGGKAITFHVETCTYPNWDGTTQKRALKVKGDELAYTVAPSAGGPPAEVVWKRIK